MLLNVKGGEKEVKISKRVFVSSLSIVFLVALVSVVPVNAHKPYRWWNESYLNAPTLNPTWIGDIWTEGLHGGIHGELVWNNTGAIFLGPDGLSTQKFWGFWWIDFDVDGEVDILGYHDGSFTYARNQYTINGRVTYTSEAWEHMIGWKIHTVGFVDWELGYSEGYIQFN